MKITYEELNKITMSEEKKLSIIQKLEARAGNSPDRSLKRMKKMMKLFCVKSLRVINIAGTNGKGTVSNTIFNCLRDEGLNVGLYISPHLVRYSERIRTAKGEIDEELLLKLIDIISSAENDIADEYGYFTYFEVLTLAMLVYFTLEDIDIAVIEAGVGGRFDVTKAIDKSFLSVITSISIDHISYLGDNVREIAWHKAGIMDKGVCVTLNENEALEEITKESTLKNIKLRTKKDFKFKIDGKPIDIKDVPSIGSFTLKYLTSTITINPRQIGVIRGENFALAFAGIIEAYNYLDIKIDEQKLEQIAASINACFWEGRMHTIYSNPLTVLDGSHNEDAILKLYKSAESIPHSKLTTIVAFMNTKEHKKMAEYTRSKSDTLIVTTNGDKKSVDLSSLKSEANADHAFENVADAIVFARESSNPDDLILICGSLYLVGLVLDYVNK